MKGDLDIVKQPLQDHVESVAKALLPEGRRRAVQRRRNMLSSGVH